MSLTIRQNKIGLKRSPVVHHDSQPMAVLQREKMYWMHPAAEAES